VALRHHVLVGAAALFVAGTARAEPELPDRSIVCAIVFPAEVGPRRASGPGHAGPVQAAAVRPWILDWISPIFVWVEPGHVFAHVTLAI
jgi:hypothetical protein